MTLMPSSSKPSEPYLSRNTPNFNPVDAGKEGVENHEESSPESDLKKIVASRVHGKKMAPVPLSRVSNKSELRSQDQPHSRSTVRGMKSNESSQSKLKIQPSEIRLKTTDSDTSSHTPSIQVRTLPPKESSRVVARPKSTWESRVQFEFPGKEEATTMSDTGSKRIEVRIGRVEIRATKSSVSQPHVVTQRPCGFDEYSRTRTCQDRKWY
jgi:hypothetical protein